MDTFYGREFSEEGNEAASAKATATPAVKADKKAKKTA
jgi:acetaldehyde dehydrogenase/alcohol dehydrogenase